MKKILLGGSIVLIIFLTPGIGIGFGQYFWRDDRIFQQRLEEIDKRIKETEEKMWFLDAQQILNRIEWVNWGIDILQRNQQDLMKEMEKEREKMEEARESRSNWEIWEAYGKRFDKLERKKARLDTMLGKLNQLRNKLKERLRELKAEYEPKAFALGLGVGSLKLENTSTQIWELKLRTPKIDFFYGSDGEKDETHKSISYFGAEMPIGGWISGDKKWSDTHTCWS
jgi:hypothetical protein